MFAGRYEEGGDFSDQGIEGSHRFMFRVWDLVQRYLQQEAEGELPVDARQVLHRTIKRVTHDIPELKYNTAIAALMEYANELQRRPALHGDEVRTLLLLLAPFAPYITEELWEQTGGAYSIHNQAWPAFDEQLAKASEVAVAVQIDGRTRDVIQVEAGSAEAAVVALAQQSPKVQRHLDGKAIARTIYVPDKLVSFVTKG